MLASSPSLSTRTKITFRLFFSWEVGDVGKALLGQCGAVQLYYDGSQFRRRSGVLSLAGPYHKQRGVGGMEDLVGDAAQQPPADTGTTVGRHGDQRARILLRLIDNQMCGSPFPYRLFNHHANLFHRLTDGVKISRRLVSVGLGHGVPIPAVKRVS